MVDDNDRVTIAVLKTELTHLDKRSDERHQELVRRFDRHEEDHKEEAETFKAACNRITNLEHWRTEHKAEIGKLAKINAVISAACVALAELGRWVISRGPGP